MNLYWVQTEDHDEDWFIVAHDEFEASDFHEDAEGYDRDEAWAELVVPIPKDVESEVGWPTNELLLACGARIVRDDTPRLVEFGDRQFCEGMLEHAILQMNDDLFEAQGQERLNKTDRHLEN